MNKLLTVILSFTLIILPVTGIAQENASQKFAENPDAKDKGSMMNTLMVMSNAALGANIVAGCVAGASIAGSSMAFMAGSLIYILGEITAGKDKNNLAKKRAEDLKLSAEKMKGTGETQKKALEMALQEQKDMLSFVKKRKSWMTVANIAYIAAAGLAIMEAFPLTFPVFSGACPQLVPLSVPWVLGIELAYTLVLGMASGETFAAILGPVVLLAAAIFIPGMMTPVTRAALFTAAAGFAIGAAGDLAAKENVIQGNIDKLQSALDQFNAENGTSSSSSLASQDSQGDQNKIGLNGQTNTEAAGTISALSTGNSAISSGEKICASTGSNGKVSIGSDCSRPVTISTSKFSASVPELQSAAQTAAQTANQLAAGNSAGAEVSAASLNAMAAAVTKAKDRTLANLNKQLRSEGKKPVDLDAEAKKVTDQMKTAMASAMNKGGAPLLAAMSPFAGSSQTSTAVPAKDEATSAVTSATAAAQAVLPSTDLAAVPATNEAAPSGTAAATPTLSEKLGDYEMSEEDISKKKEESIFRQVSNRYFLNYDKIFERKKVVPVTD